MNNELVLSITLYMKNIANYIYMEYDKTYHQKYISYDTQYLYDFVGSYYLSGHSVPDATRYVIEFLKMN
jgi:hypothetical protein